MRVAVVDIGSNSTRLLIADVDGGRVVGELERRSTVTRLGQGVDTDGRLRDDAMQRVYDTLDDYQAEMDRHGCQRRVAVLTSAVRDSANGEEFAETVRTRYGLEPHVLTGDQEAEMTFRGATSERDPDDRQTTLVFDIGGGSTEIVIGSGTEVDFHVSTQAGVVRQTERHLHDDPPTQAQQDELSDEVRAILEAAVPAQRRRGVSQGIGVAGTATSLAAIAQELEPYDPGPGTRLPARGRASATGSWPGWRRCRWSSAARWPGCIPTAPRRSSPGCSSSARCCGCSGCNGSRSQSTTSCAAPR